MTRLVALQHLQREGPGLFALEAAHRGWPIRIVRLDLGEPLPHLEPDDLLLVLGGPMGVADPPSWEKAAMYVVMCVVLIFCGGGLFSLDNLLIAELLDLSLD